MKKQIVLALTGCVFLGKEVPAQSAEKHLGQGNQYYRSAQYDLAEREYRLALQKAPQNTTAQFNLATALYRQKKWDEAFKILKELEASRENKNFRSAVHYNTGVMHTKQKNLEASIEAYKSALRLNPNDNQARENLQKALQELKKQQEQQKKDQKEKQQRNPRMSQNEAERKLKQLMEKEKDIQQRLQKDGQRGNRMTNDW